MGGHDAMRVFAAFSFRNGADILESRRKCDAFAELCSVLRQLPPYRQERAMTDDRHVCSPIAMNRWLDHELSVRRDWEWHPLTNGADSDSGLRSDFRKARIEVEVQFGNIARYAYDLIKMAIAHARDHADVGVLVMPTYRFTTRIGVNLAHIERAIRELKLMRGTLDVPVVVVGLEPETWNVDEYPCAPAVTERPSPTTAQLGLHFNGHGR